MKINPTSKNKALVARALRHLSAAAEAQKVSFGGSLRPEINRLRGSLLKGDVDMTVLGELKEIIYANRHCRMSESKALQTAVYSASDCIHSLQ